MFISKYWYKNRLFPLPHHLKKASKGNDLDWPKIKCEKCKGVDKCFAVAWHVIAKLFTAAKVRHLFRMGKEI